MDNDGVADRHDGYGQFDLETWFLASGAKGKFDSNDMARKRCGHVPLSNDVKVRIQGIGTRPSRKPGFKPLAPWQIRNRRADSKPVKSFVHA